MRLGSRDEPCMNNDRRRCTCTILCSRFPLFWFCIIGVHGFVFSFRRLAAFVALYFFVLCWISDNFGSVYLSGIYCTDFFVLFSYFVLARIRTGFWLCLFIGRYLCWARDIPCQTFIEPTFCLCIHTFGWPKCQAYSSHPSTHFSYPRILHLNWFFRCCYFCSRFSSCLNELDSNITTNEPTIGGLVVWSVSCKTRDWLILRWQTSSAFVESSWWHRNGLIKMDPGGLVFLSCFLLS